MHEIEIRRDDVEQFLSRFTVVVNGEAGPSHHTVTLSRTDFERLGRNYRTPEKFMEACFAFLLARESGERILSSFDISQIKTYFPEFEELIEQPPA